MKSKMILIVILIIGILIGVFLDKEIFNRDNNVTNKKNILFRRNILENNSGNAIVGNKHYVNISGFNIENYLNKKEKEWKHLWNLSDKELYELLENNIKFEQKYKVDDLCNYLYFGKDDYKLKRCRGMSYNFISRVEDILTYKLLIGTNISYKSDIKNEIRDLLFENNKKFLKKKFLNFLKKRYKAKGDKMAFYYYRIMSTNKFMDCKGWDDTKEDLYSLLIFFYKLINDQEGLNKLLSTNKDLKKFYQNYYNTKFLINNFYFHSYHNLMNSYLVENYRGNLNCVKNVYNKLISNFIKSLKKLIY